MLKEDMKHVLYFLEWKSAWWMSHQTAWYGLDDTVADSLKVYALHQAALYTSLATSFRAKWEAPAVKAA